MFFFSVKSCTYKLSYHLNTPLFYLILMSNKLYSWCISFQSGNISFFALPVYHQLNLKAWVTFQLISLENCVGFVTLIHSPNAILEQVSSFSNFFIFVLHLCFYFTSSKDPHKIGFKNILKGVFVEEAKYLQEKIPLNNLFLKMVSSIHPWCHSSNAAERMRKSKYFFLNILVSHEQRDKHDKNVSNFHSAKHTLTCNIECLDSCWNKVFALEIYCRLEKVIKACL